MATVKRCQKKMIDNNKLSFDEIQTVMLEIENVINSKLLCYLNDDDVEEILTPNHLLYRRQLNVNIVNADIDKNYNFSEERLTNRRRYLNTVLLHFWKRWSAEYLISLRERSITMRVLVSKCHTSMMLFLCTTTNNRRPFIKENLPRVINSSLQ